MPPSASQILRRCAVEGLLLVFVGTPAQADDAFAGSGAGLFNTYGFDTEISSSWTPFQLTLVPYLQFFRSDVEVCGLNLAALLTNLNENDILFVDEIHRLNRSVEEVLYPAMEDYAIDIIIGKGPSANSIRLDLPRFTLIGATTRAGQLSAPLRDRFGVTLRLELYTPEELALIVTRSAGILDAPIEPEGAMEIARRSRGTPRIANRMLRRVRDFAQVVGDGVITRALADKALTALEVDRLGLDNIDRRMLRAIIEYYGGGPVGLETLAATINEEAVTLEDVYEPYLMQIGFLTRTPRGRCVTAKAYEHLGLRFPGSGEMEQMTL